MFELIAQSYSTYDTTTSAGVGAGLALFGGMFLIIWLAVFVVAVIAMWKVFEKAGVEGWKAIIPIYNSWTLAEIAGKPGWWALVFLIAWIPFVGPIAAVVVWVIIALELAKKFGKDTAFAIFALIIFSLIGLLILGFGDAKYIGPPYKTLDQGDGNKSDPKPKA